jgi:3'-5' exoribonuclease
MRLSANDLRDMHIQPMPSAGASTVSPMLVRDLQDGQDLDQVLLVRAVELRSKRDGSAFLRLSLGDRTGRVVGVMWDGVAELEEDLCQVGAAVRVEGRYERHARWGPQITIDALSAPAPGSYDVGDLVDGSPHDVGQMERDLRQLVSTIQNPHLRALLDRVLGEHTETWRAYREAPAAKHYHQAYLHGLLEHSLSVALGVHALAASFPGIDHDVAVTGALLHDIGKLDAYTTDPTCIDMTDAGRLLGEIPLGYYRIRREIEDMPGFPPETAQAVLHIILSHHGTLEHGSPVVPCTREATLVHHIDNLGGRLGSFDRLEKGLAAGETWTGYDRALGGSAYFGPAVADERRAA